MRIILEEKIHGFVAHYFSIGDRRLRKNRRMATKRSFGSEFNSLPNAKRVCTHASTLTFDHFPNDVILLIFRTRTHLLCSVAEQLSSNLVYQLKRFIRCAKVGRDWLQSKMKHSSRICLKDPSYISQNQSTWILEFLDLKLKSIIQLCCIGNIMCKEKESRDAWRVSVPSKYCNTFCEVAWKLQLVSGVLHVCKFLDSKEMCVIGYWYFWNYKHFLRQVVVHWCNFLAVLGILLHRFMKKYVSL